MIYRNFVKRANSKSSHHKEKLLFFFLYFLLYLYKNLNVSWTYCHNHFMVHRNQTVGFNLYRNECQFFLPPKMGKRSLKKCKPFLWELTLPVPSVCMGQWWQGSLVRPPSWKTWSLSWGNIEEWPPPTRRQVLSRVVGLRRIEKLEGEKGWWPGGWNSLDKGSALTQVGYCSAKVLNCETSLCTVVGVGIVTK